LGAASAFQIDQTEMKLNVSAGDAGKTLDKFQNDVLKQLSSFKKYSTQIGGHSAKGTFCQALLTKDNDVLKGVFFDVKPFSDSHRVKNAHTGKFKKHTEFALGTTDAPTKFMGKICSTKESSTVLQGASSSKKPCKFQGNFFTFDKDDNCVYSYNGAKISTLNVTTGNKTGFALTYSSHEKCVSASNATQKYQVILHAVCADTEGTVTHTKINNCKEMMHVSSPGACKVFDYGKYLGAWMAKLQKFVGVILIVLGAVLLWKGYHVFTGLKAVLIGSIVWCALFGIGYNLFPADKLNMTTFFVMLGVTLLIAGIASIFLVKLVDHLMFPLLCGYLGAVLAVLVVGLIKMAGNHKVVVIAAIVGFIGGGVYGYQNDK
jgi:hypothetical protein